MRWRSPHLVILYSFLAFLVGEATVSGFKICAYNVQKFSISKASNRALMHTLTRVLSRCDISLLQEVVDPNGKAIKVLLSSLNRYNNDSYSAVSSKSLGKDPKDMQQYVFVYRTKSVRLVAQHQYQKVNSFTREPFAVQFESNKTAIKKFILVPLHTDPNQAIQEIDRLYDVFMEVKQKWNNENVMFLGDFHAGCAYVTRSDKKNIRLFQSKFLWLIGDREDTTVTDSTNCAYDRIVVHGKSFMKAISPFSAKVFKFGKYFKLSKTKVRSISDHYPVEVRLKSSALLLQATPLLILLATVQSFLSAL